MTENLISDNMIWKCLFSPRLKRIYKRGSDSTVQQYEMTGIEKYGDRFVSTITTLWNIGFYTSPIILLYLYRRNYFQPEGLILLLKFSTSVCVIFAMSLYLRSLGRVNQPAYIKFLKTLETYESSMTLDNKRELQKYDFDFKFWPVEYKASTIETSHDEEVIKRGILTIPLQLAAYIAIHTFGIRLIYPGSIGLIQTLLDANLVQGRERLVGTFNGQRFKLETADKNKIDTMFVDNRNSTSKGNILFICSEGNAGFYEIGIMTTPVEAGYSALGWNHPGFAGSTGSPYPPQEKTGIDAVVDFAINKLGFKVEDIVLYGWSIGGFTTSWAAMKYPNIRGVILDASFDDVLPLAIAMMPKAISSIVEIAIRDYVNLNIIMHLKKFQGPVLFVRRSEDEVICTEEQNISTNRGNFLVKKLLKYRYPLIFEDQQLEVLNEFFARAGPEQESFVGKYGNDDQHCLALLKSYVAENSKSYPMQIGSEMDAETKTKLAVYLVRQYQRDYNSSHCTPLPVEYLGYLTDSNDSGSLI